MRQRTEICKGGIRTAALSPGHAAGRFAAEAETCAELHRRRAQPIRRLGGLPGDCDFGPPEPELVHAIVTGTTLALRALDAAAAT